MKSTTPSLAKITPPRLPKIVERTRLYRELDRARTQYPIIWITAPPGMGKTTLAASYLKARKLRCLWCQVDEGDADPATLFHYLGLAARKAAPRYRQPLPHLTPEYLPGLPIFTRRFFEALYGRLRPPAMMVLDNYQQMPKEGPCQELLSIGFQVIPDQVQVMVLSRAAPPPALARLQAEQKVCCLQEADLHLTEQETASIIRLKGGVQRDPSQKSVVKKLHRVTGGWIAGVVLSLEHGQLDSLQSDTQQVRPPEVVFDFLAREVMKELPVEVQEVLLRTAFASSVTETMTQMLTTNPKAGKILNDLCQRRYFTERRVEDEPVYQYHQMFRAFLQTTSKEQLTESELTKLLRDTGKVLLEHGRREEAVELFQEAQAVNECVEVILGEAKTMLAQGRYLRLEEWIRWLPEGSLEQHPWLLYWLGSCKRFHDFSASERFLTSAFEAFQARHDQTGMLVTWAGIVDVILMGWEDWKRVDPWIDLLPELIQDRSTFPESEIDYQVLIAMCSALCWRRPGHPDSLKWLERGAMYLDQQPDSVLPSTFHHLYVSLFLTLGDINDASAIVQEIKIMARGPNTPPIARLSLFYAQAHFAWFVGDRAWCDQAVSEAISLESQTGCLVMHLPLRFQTVYAALLEYDIISAEHILAEVCPSRQHFPKHMKFHFDWLVGWTALLKSDLDCSRLALRQAFNDSVTCGVPFPNALTRLTLAQACDEAEAQKHIAEAELIGQEIRSALIDSIAQLTRASIALNKAKNKEAKGFLEGGFRVSRIQGFRFFSWWPKQVLTRLCVKALEWEIEVEYVRQIVRNYRLTPDEQDGALLNWPWPVKVTTLGKFEIEVNDQAVTFGRKVPRRVLALLQALIAFGGKDVPELTLIDALWPEADGDRAYRSYATTLHRLRKLLGDEKTIIVQDSKITLNADICWVDVWAFEHLLDQAVMAKKEEDRQKGADLCWQALQLYQGPFLHDHDHENAPWAARTRERLRKKYLAHVEHLCKSKQQDGKVDEARVLFEQALNHEPEGLNDVMNLSQ